MPTMPRGSCLAFAKKRNIENEHKVKIKPIKQASKKKRENANNANWIYSKFN